MASKSKNPLQGYLRSPKLYINLPSEGKFAKVDTISKVSNELPIYPLTSMDETFLRNPDALLNGESLVAVIKSCTGIQDVYELSANDIDVILLAIRYATYGSELEIESICPECKTENIITVNIEELLESIEPLKDSYTVTLKSGLTCNIKPYTFKDSQTAALTAFKETAELNTLINSDADDLSRLTNFNKSFQAMAELNIDILSNAISTVVIPKKDDEEEDIEVTNNKYIAEWVRGISKMDADEIIDELNVINELGITRAVDTTCKECSNEYEATIEFNPSNFFETGS
jgi:hypothetical protein